MSHSPGPWVVRPHALASGWMQIGSLDVAGNDTLTAECEPSNAALIAGAPEMLELLREMTDDLLGEWKRDHDERCGNRLTTDNRCEHVPCYCGRPDSLDKARAILARLTP